MPRNKQLWALRVGSSDFWIKHDYWLHQLIVTLVTCWKPAQDQLSQHSTKLSQDPKASDLAGRQLTVGSFKRKEGGLLSFEDMTIGRQPCPSRWAHRHAHVGSTNWTQKLRGKWERSSMQGWREEVMLKIHCINVYTFQRRNKILFKKLRVEIVC